MTGGFTDLRQFLDRLRRDGDLAIVTAPVDVDLEAAEIHRRVIAAGGPALLFTSVSGKAFPLVTNLFGTARRAELAFGTPATGTDQGRLVHLAETLLPPTLGKLWGARDTWDVELLRVGLQTPPDRSNHGRRHRRCPTRRSAGAHLLARRRRPIHHAAARLHRAPAPAGAQPRHVPPPGARPPDHGHALADREGRRVPLRGGGSRGPGASGDGLSRRSAGAHAVGHRAAARERPRAAAGVTHRRRAPAGDVGTRFAPAGCRGGVRARSAASPRESAGPRVRSAITTATTRCGTSIRCSRSGDCRPPQGRHLSRHGRRQAASGGLLHRRPAPGSPVAALPARHARRAAPLVLRRNRLSLARRARWFANATAAKRWRARSASSARASCR